MANTNSLQESATLGSATPRDAGGLLRATRERISAGDEPAQAAAWRVLRRALRKRMANTKGAHPPNPSPAVDLFLYPQAAKSFLDGLEREDDLLRNVLGLGELNLR